MRTMQVMSVAPRKVVLKAIWRARQHQPNGTHVVTGRVSGKALAAGTTPVASAIPLKVCAMMSRRNKKGTGEIACPC